MKRLEEIEKWAKKCGCSQCKEKLFLLSEVHRLRGAIKKHNELRFGKDWRKIEISELYPEDQELYKALKEEE